MGEPLGQDLGETLLAHLGLRLLDRVRGSAEDCPPSGLVNLEPGRSRVAVARLSDRAGVDETARSDEIERRAGFRKPAAEREPVARQLERDVAVPDQDERLPGRG